MKDEENDDEEGTERGGSGLLGAFLGGRGGSHGIGDTEARLVAAAACCYHAIDAAAAATPATAAATADAACLPMLPLRGRLWGAGLR